MPKITYHEYRPGRWVKLVDGKAVGPATVQEVAQWRQEQAEQTKIWRDVLTEAAEAAPAQAQRAALGPHEGQAVQAEEGSIWQDVVSQVERPRTQPAATGEPPEPEPPLRTVEEAIQSARRGKPVRVTGGRVVSGDKPIAPAGPSGLPEAQTKPAEELPEPKPGLTEAPPRTARATPARAAKPTQKRKRAEVARQEAQTQPAVEADSTKEPRPSRQRARAVPPQRVAKAEPTPVPETKVVEQPPKPARKPAKAVAPKKAAELEALPEMKPTPIAEPVKPAPRQARPAREPVKAEPVPKETVLPADDVAEEEPRSEASVARPRETTRARPRRAAVPRRRKAVSTPSIDRLSPAYLWIMVGATEDLVAAVRGGLTKYEERFDQRAGAVLCHAEDLAALDEAKLSVDVRPRKGVPRRNFWIGPK